MKNTPKPQGPRAKGGPELRALAFQLLAEGLTVAEVSRRLEVRRATVSGWKNSPEGRAAIEAAHATVARKMGDALGDARAILRANVLEAVRTLVSQLTNPDASVALRAACTILDRGGLPAVAVVQPEENPLDLSKLSDEELDTFERLMGKVSATSSRTDQTTEPAQRTAA
jgi:DNA-binding MarR family transcriptional regulator